jgi:hypothetical protein
MNICDPKFKWVPPVHTDVSKTWARFGFRPTTEKERLARQEKDKKELATVLPIAKRKHGGTK